MNFWPGALPHSPCRAHPLSSAILSSYSLTMAFESCPPSPTSTTYSELDLVNMRPLTPEVERWELVEWAPGGFPVWHIHSDQPEQGARWYHYSSIEEFDDWAHAPNIYQDQVAWFGVENWFIHPPSWIPA